MHKERVEGREGEEDVTISGGHGEMVLGDAV